MVSYLRATSLTISIVVVLICLFLLYFYRKPSVIIRNENTNIIYSPAFGKIMDVKRRDDNTVFIAIFLSPIDYHYQYSPINGIYKSIIKDYSGGYALAYNLNKSATNKKVIHLINTEYGDIQLVQIAGALARRIDTYKKEGDMVVTGEKIGFIQFGSRVDLILPDANNFILNVNIGDKVTAKTELGYYESF